MPFDGTAMPGTGRDPAADLIAELKAQHTLHAAREVWDSALCAQVDPELFFPKLGQPATDAKAVCAACPVRARCLDVFGDLVLGGIVGGLSTRERRTRRVQTRRNGAAA